MDYTIVYLTNREEPLLHWTVESLGLQIPESERGNVQIVVVDKFAEDEGRRGWAKAQLESGLKGCDFVHTPAKPNVWSGPCRLTSEDYFAPSNYRNTGILLAKAPVIAFLDDLSVVCPGWWDHIKQVHDSQEVILGTYEKHRHMYVEGGVLVYSDPHTVSVDSRRSTALMRSSDRINPISCSGSWMYGCSFACPTEALLQSNGFDEDCDSMGSEDYITGMIMEQKGWNFKFCPGMKTIESDTHHEFGEVATRVIKPMGDTDASYVILNWVKQNGRDKCAFYSNDHLTLRDAREKVLSTGILPECSIPEHDWRDGTPLRNM